MITYYYSYRYVNAKRKYTNRRDKTSVRGTKTSEPSGRDSLFSGPEFVFTLSARVLTEDRGQEVPPEGQGGSEASGPKERGGGGTKESRNHEKSLAGRTHTPGGGDVSCNSPPPSYASPSTDAARHNNNN